MFYILYYNTVDNYIEKRKPFRELHLNYAKASHDRGELFLAGALANPADEAVLVFKCDSSKIVEDFAKNDPYVLNGLIKEWKVRKWTVVIGN